MKRRVIVAIGLVALVLTVSGPVGCYNLSHSAKGAGLDTVAMSRMSKSQGTYFIHEERVHIFVYGLVSPRKFQVDWTELVQKNLQEGEMLTNVEITSKISFVDALLLCITWGIYTPMTVEIKGEIRNIETK